MGGPMTQAPSPGYGYPRDVRKFPSLIAVWLTFNPSQALAAGALLLSFVFKPKELKPKSS